MRENIVIMWSSMDKQIPCLPTWNWSKHGQKKRQTLNLFFFPWIIFFITASLHCFLSLYSWQLLLRSLSWLYHGHSSIPLHVPTTLSLLEILLPFHPTELEKNTTCGCFLHHPIHTTLLSSYFQDLVPLVKQLFSLFPHLPPSQLSLLLNAWVHKHILPKSSLKLLALPGKPGCSGPSLPSPSPPDLFKLSLNARKFSQLFLPALLPRILPLPAMELPFQLPLLPWLSCCHQIPVLLHKE